MYCTVVYRFTILAIDQILILKSENFAYVNNNIKEICDISMIFKIQSVLLQSLSN